MQEHLMKFMSALATELGRYPAGAIPQNPQNLGRIETPNSKPLDPLLTVTHIVGEIIAQREMGARISADALLLLIKCLYQEVTMPLASRDIFRGNAGAQAKEVLSNRVDSLLVAARDNAGGQDALIRIEHLDRGATLLINEHG